MRIGLWILFVISVTGITSAAAFASDSDKPAQPTTVTFSREVAHSAALLPDVPSSRIDCADVSADLSGR